MRRQLPPLNAIRAFEASARHLSFTRAAEELAVTQAAVSQQVRRLEDWLQVKLFRRLEGRLELTQAGHVYVNPLTRALDQIADATARIRPGARHGLLSISTTPPFAGKWLVPRLARFMAANPEVEVRVATSNRLVDFDQEGVDLAVRLGPGGWPGLEAEKLFDEEVFPVCGPALMAGPHPLDRAAGPAATTPWLHDDSLVHLAANWLSLAGCRRVEWTRDHGSANSAQSPGCRWPGRGWRWPSASGGAPTFPSARLVKPFRLVVRHAYGFHVVVKAGALERPAVRAFRDLAGFAEACRHGPPWNDGGRRWRLRALNVDGTTRGHRASTVKSDFFERLIGLKKNFSHHCAA